MLDQELYVKYDINTKKMLDTFFKLLIEWRTKNFINVLQGYSKLEGNAVNEEMRCYFASEYQKNEEEYFGDTGIAFYFDYPAVDKDCIVILSYNEFWDVLNEKCQDYLRLDSSKEDEIAKLLSCIMERLQL